MEHRIDNIERRMDGMQTAMQEALRKQMEEMMTMVTERLEAVFGEIRGWKEERVKKVEVPYFMGDDPHGWVYRLERYFEIHHVPEAEKVDTAAEYLKGKASNWFQWWEPRMAAVTWPAFRHAVVGYFQRTSRENPYEALRSLRQNGTVLEYLEQFELQSAPLRFADEEFLKGVFMNGLKEDIKAEVRLMSSGGLHELMEMSQKVEERNKILGQSQWYSNQGNGPGIITTALPGQWVGAQDLKHTVPGAQETHMPYGDREHSLKSLGGSDNTNSKEVAIANTGSREMGSKLLTEEEDNEKRRHKLCFRCEERYFPGLVRKNKQIPVLLLGEEDETHEEGDGDFEKESGEFHLQLNVSSIGGVGNGQCSPGEKGGGAMKKLGICAHEVFVKKPVWSVHGISHLINLVNVGIDEDKMDCSGHCWTWVAATSSFKQWDPGKYGLKVHLVLHLEDKVNV